MDPYLEDPAVWPDFHDRLAEQISATLNETLPAPFYAQLRRREEIGIAGDMYRSIIPDVSVHRDPRSMQQSPTGPRVAVSESIEIIADEPFEANFVEIVDAGNNDEVVTLVEILSPSNKSPGPDRESYLRKRNDVLRSDVSLVEIDLLREGDRTLFGAAAYNQIRSLVPPAEYLAFISRAWKPRGGGSGQLFPARLTDPLPVISIPLHETLEEAPLDLQHCLRLAYDRGPYRRRIDYTSPPVVPLSLEMQRWAEDQLRQATHRA
jgi:hypothetical protein